MSHLREGQVLSAAPTARDSLWLPAAAGGAFNLASLAVGAPYPMAAAGLVAALVAAFAWADRPLAWVVFVAVLAANPANPTTPVALNLLAAGALVLLARESGWRTVPRAARAAFALVLVSLAASLLASLAESRKVPGISITAVDLPRAYSTTWTGGPTQDIFPTQVLAAVNYLLGPFLLLPLAFSRLWRDHPPGRLVAGFLAGLVVPTLAVFLLARAYGRPVMDANVLGSDLLNVTTFRLGKVDVQMIRTQSGIILASLLCASFALASVPIARGVRAGAAACLAIAAYLMLLTGSVGSMIAALSGLGVILLLGLRRFSLLRTFTVLAVTAGVALAAWQAMPRSVQRYATSRYEVRVGKGGDPLGGRSIRWQRSLAYLGDHPSGVGWSLYVESLGIYPHNDFLTYAIAFGVLGGLAYFLCPVGLLLAFLAVKPRPPDEARFALALAGAGVTTVLLVNSMSDHLTANRWYFNVIWSLAWYAFFASRAPREAPSASPGGGA